MLNPYKYIIPIFLYVLALVLFLIFYHGCKRGDQEGGKTVFIQQGLLEADRKRSTEQAKARKTIDSLIQRLQAVQKPEKIIYYEYQRKGKEAETAYVSGVIPCDSVIHLKNKALVVGNRIIARCDSIHGLDSAKHRSFAYELSGKDSTIGKLNDMLVKEQTKKKPIEIFATLSGSKYPNDGNFGIGGVVALPNGLMVGYSKGIIHDSHDVTVGYRLKFGR